MNRTHSAIVNEAGTRRQAEQETPRWRRLDRGLDLLLLGLPMLLAICVMLTAMASPVPQASSDDEFSAWLLNEALQAQHRVNWQGVLHPVQSAGWLNSSDWSQARTSDAYMRGSILLDLEMQAAVQAALAEHPEDPRLVWLAASCIPDDYDSAEPAHARVAYLEEQDRLGRLDRNGLELLALSIYYISPRQISDQQQYWRQQNYAWFNPLGNWQDSGLEQERFERIQSLLQRADAMPVQSASQLTTRFTQLVNNTEYEAAAALLAEHAELPAETGTVDQLAMLGIRDTEQLDELSRASLQFMGIGNITQLVRLRPQTYSELTTELLEQGRTDILQEFHVFNWKLGGANFPQNNLMSCQQMLDAIPPTVLHDPANADFRRAQLDCTALSRNAFLNQPGFSQNILEMAYDSMEFKLSGQRLGLYGPNPLWQNYYISQNSRTQQLAALGPSGIEDLQELQELDWTSLILSGHEAEFLQPEPAAEQ
ncbi:MAG: hypothetical protein R3F46_15090 [bacterium]